MWTTVSHKEHDIHVWEKQNGKYVQICIYFPGFRGDFKP